MIEIDLEIQDRVDLSEILEIWLREIEILEAEILMEIDLELALTEDLVGDEILFEMIEDLTEEDLMMGMEELVWVDLQARGMMIDNLETQEEVDLIEIETSVDMIEDMKVEALTHEEGMIEDMIVED